MLSLLYYGEVLTNNKMVIKVLNEGTDIGWIQVKFSGKLPASPQMKVKGGWGTQTKLRSGGWGTSAAGEGQALQARSTSALVQHPDSRGIFLCSWYLCYSQ